RPYATFTRSQEPARDMRPPIVRMNREAVDPTLPAIVSSEDDSHQSPSVEGAQVPVAGDPELGRNRGAALPPSGPRLHPADFQQRNQVIVVGEPKAANPDRHRHHSRETRCRVGCAKRSTASRGNWSRKKDGIKPELGRD